jgi:2-polyprenyl-3-methyl-5-hydroxy-6-metoxy-1,4-benzoquinol methylase
MADQIQYTEYLYGEKARKCILPFLKERVTTALDIGCGFGNTLAWLKKDGYCKKTFGVEINAHAAETARKQLDGVYCGNIETMDVPVEPESINLLLCLDVLEHLNDPWTTLMKIQKQLLAPGGILIASVPNVQHYSVVLSLLFRGKWTYSTAGLLDRTHLRFFTRRTAVEMVTNAGFHVETITAAELGKSIKLFNLFTANIFRPFTVFQYLIRARKL